VTEREPTRALIAWAFYDWANSSFATVVQTFVFAAYFTRQVAENPTVGTALWGNTIAAAGFIVAVAGPVMGAIADQSGRRKPWLLSFTLLAVAATALLWLVRPEPQYQLLGLVLVAVGTVGTESAAIFYNAMLPDLAPPRRVGRWSGWGWGFGYAGGLCCLLLALFGFIRADAWLPLPQAEAAPVRATFLLTAGWFFVFSLPIALLTPDARSQGRALSRALGDGLRQLRTSLRHIRQYAGIVRFLVARMIVIDGLATLFAFGGVYAAGTFAMSEQQVLLLGILLNVTAGLGAAAFAWIDDWLGAKRTILASLAGLAAAGTLVLLTPTTTGFWVWAAVLGVFVGPAQAAGRSYLSRAAPPALRTELFGLFALSGKATAFVGPLLVGWVTYLAGSQRIGMGTIVVFFVLGFVLMLTVPGERGLKTEDSGQNPGTR
jgi:UMF1 family MFS transporter